MQYFKLTKAQENAEEVGVEVSLKPFSPMVGLLGISMITGATQTAHFIYNCFVPLVKTHRPLISLLGGK